MVIEHIARTDDHFSSLRGIAESDADIAKDRGMLTAGLNRWGQRLLPFGTSLDVPKSKIPCPTLQSIKATASLSFSPQSARRQRRDSGDDRCWSMPATPELWAFIVSAEKR